MVELLFIFGKNIEELETLVNREMKRVQVWLENNQLTLNLKKTNYIFKSHKQKWKKELKIMLNEYEIKQIHNTEFLGVMTDEHLTWKNHINYVTCKISKNSRNFMQGSPFYREGFIVESVLLIDIPSPYLWKHCLG